MILHSTDGYNRRARFFFFCWSNFAINLIVLKSYIKWTHSETWRIRTTVNRGLRLSNKSIRSLYWMIREHLKSFILIVKKVNSIINCKFYSFYMWEIWTGSRALALSILYSHFQFGPFFPTLWTPIESKATEYIVSRWSNYEYKNMQHFIYVMRYSVLMMPFGRNEHFQWFAFPVGVSIFLRFYWVMKM